MFFVSYSLLLVFHSWTKLLEGAEVTCSRIPHTS
jgi:hypothetical protein